MPRALLDLGELQPPQVQLDDLRLVGDPRTDVPDLPPGGHHLPRRPARRQVPLDRGQRRTRQIGQILDREQPALDPGLAGQPGQTPLPHGRQPLTPQHLPVLSRRQLQVDLHLAARRDRLPRRFFPLHRQIAQLPRLGRHLPVLREIAGHLLVVRPSQHRRQVEIGPDPRHDRRLPILRRQTPRPIPVHEPPPAAHTDTPRVRLIRAKRNPRTQGSSPWGSRD